MPSIGASRLTAWLGARANSRQSSLSDCLFVVAIGALSMATYEFRLGLYSDDWALLASMKLSERQSLVDVFTEIVRIHDHEIRPVQFFEFAVLYKLFGLDPLGYHLTNAVIFLLNLVLLFLLVRALGQSRVLALSVAVVFMLVPSYSTDRFWIASAAANLSMFFFLLSLHAHWQALRDPQHDFWRWEAFAVLGVLASGFCYEVFLPLFLMATAFLFISELTTQWPHSARGRVVSKAVLHQTGIVGAVALILVVKALWAPRVPRNLELIGLVLWTGRAILKAGVMNYLFGRWHRAVCRGVFAVPDQPGRGWDE
jgi:hypothetical protein